MAIGIENAIAISITNKERIVCAEDDVQSIAKEIMSYLYQRPMAADTLDGIAYWRLVQQAITKNVGLVEQALEQLVREGKVAKNTRNHRDAIYFLNTTDKPVED